MQLRMRRSKAVEAWYTFAMPGYVAGAGCLLGCHLIPQPMLGRIGMSTGCCLIRLSMAARMSSPVTKQAVNQLLLMRRAKVNQGLAVIMT